jgi:hypothetical protein
MAYAGSIAQDACGRFRGTAANTRLDCAARNRAVRITAAGLWAIGSEQVHQRGCYPQKR